MLFDKKWWLIAIMLILVVLLLLSACASLSTKQQTSPGVTPVVAQAPAAQGEVCSQPSGVSFGLAKDVEWNSREHNERANEYGIDDFATLYYHVHSRENRRNPFAWINSEYVKKDIPVVLALIINGEGMETIGRSEVSEIGDASKQGNLQLIVDGFYDEALRELANEIADIGACVIIRPLYEINGDWFPWGVYTQGNSIEVFHSAWRHVWQIFHDAGAPVLFELNYNRRSPEAIGVSDFREIFPGREYVDMVSVSSYNRCKTAQGTYQETRSFEEEFAPAYEELASFFDGPINVAEVGTSDLCSLQIPWHKELLDSLSRFPQLHMVTYYMGTVPIGAASNDVPIVWGLDEDEQREFRMLIESFRKTQAGSLPRGKDSSATPSLAFGSGFSIAPDSAPWSVYGRLEHFFAETGNPALNPETGEPFGKIGTRLRLHLNQGFEWDLDDETTLGPKFTLGGVVSNNDNQWWENQLFFQGEVRLCRDTSTQWGGICPLVGARHIEYFVDAPNRFNQSVVGGRGDNQVYIGVELNFGGDLQN